VLDRGVEVVDPRQRVRRVDHARAERELLHAVALALVDEQRRRPLVHLEHESWSWHVDRSPCGQSWGRNATLNVPSAPADIAWSSASRQPASGYVAPTSCSRCGRLPAAWMAVA